MAQRSQRGKRKDERSTEDETAWNGFESKWDNELHDVDVDDGARWCRCGE